MSDSDRLRERANQIDMAQNGFSLPWAKKHLSPLLRESADRIEELEGLVRDMYGFIDAACKKYPRMFDPNTGAGGQMVREMPNDRYAECMKELGVDK